jgi:hypothetical protein
MIIVPGGISIKLGSAKRMIGYRFFVTEAGSTMTISPTVPTSKTTLTLIDAPLSITTLSTV